MRSRFRTLDGNWLEYAIRWKCFCTNCLIYKQIETFISSRHVQTSKKYTDFAALTFNMRVDSSLSNRTSVKVELKVLEKICL